MSEVAWLAAVPCAVATVAAMLALGPALGHLSPPSHVTPWPSTAAQFRPESTEHARYVLALLGPLLLTAAVAAAARFAPRLPDGATRLARAAPWLVGAFVVVCVVSQRRTRFEAAYVAAAYESSRRTVYFTLPTLAAACAIAVLIAAAVRSPRLRERALALLRDTRRRRVIAWSLAVTAIAVSLLPAVNFEGTILRANLVTWYHLQFTFDETSAVLDGRSPLVDFAAQYGALWPYALAGVLSVTGASVGSFTVLTSLLSGAAMLAVYATLRRVAASAGAALLLFLPVLATSFFKMKGTLAERFSPGTFTGMFPLRIAGPFLLLWLTARHLDGARPRARRTLFAVAGLVLFNNMDLGASACAATIAALLWSELPSRRALVALAADLLVGLVAAFALVCVLTLARAGSLPHLGLLVRYEKLYGSSGYGMFPMVPLIGVSTIVFLTFVGAIGVASVRAARRAEDRLLTGLLAWSGVFGFGAGAYYMGRSLPEVLTQVFPEWALSVALLTVVVVRSLARRPARLPSVAELACLVGFGVLVCSLAQMPRPWSELRRLQATTPARLVAPAEVRFLAGQAQPGEPVAVLTTLGHRLAALAHVTDVTPYTGLDLSMPTREQLDETLRMLRAAGGHTVIASTQGSTPEAVRWLIRSGYSPVAVEAGGLVVLSDR